MVSKFSTFLKKNNLRHLNLFEIWTIRSKDYIRLILDSQKL